MDPKLASILTVFVVGIVSFLIGWLLTSSGEKGKIKKLNEENEKLARDNKKSNENTEMRKKKVDKLRADLDLASRERNEVKQKNAKLTDDNRRLENVSHSPSGKLYKQEYETLYEQYVEEMEKRRVLEREKLNWMSGGKPSEEKKNSITETSSNFLNDVKVSVSNNQSSSTDDVKTKLSFIFNRVGYGNALQRDNLTKIDGVGNEIQEKLYKIGVFNFKQIANLIPEDLKTIEASIKDSVEYFPGKALKDDWINQAKKLSA